MHVTLALAGGRASYLHCNLYGVMTCSISGVGTFEVELPGERCQTARNPIRYRSQSLSTEPSLRTARTAKLR